MRMETALEIIKGKPKGFRVHFERAGDGFLRGDFFPENDEELISTEHEAWRLANDFANKTRGGCVNIYICDQNHRPVEGYKDKEIENR